MFADLIDASLVALAPLPCLPLEVPARFACAVRQEVGGGLRLATRLWQVADVGELRVVHIQAPKINVLTLFLWPNPVCALPVHCLELVVFGQQPIVGVLDVLCVRPMPCAAAVRAFMADAHRLNPQLANADDMPAWFQECRSGHEFFIRPAQLGGLDDLAAVHLDLLGRHLRPLLATANPLDPDAARAHHLHLERYKHHHQVSSPGLKLMNRSFGEPWTAEYMRYFFQ